MKMLGNPLFQRDLELWEAISPSSRGVRSSCWTFWKALNVYFRLCNNLESSEISPKNGMHIFSQTPPWAWSQNHRLHNIIVKKWGIPFMVALWIRRRNPYFFNRKISNGSNFLLQRPQKKILTSISIRKKLIFRFLTVPERFEHSKSPYIRYI